ncbi:MAG: hypothetical protein RMY28_005565 [Nostoc sp. ChiSLP01]|nr:hypothetical protein [Nostoc sp. CmiSLP01]
MDTCPCNLPRKHADLKRIELRSVIGDRRLYPHIIESSIQNPKFQIQNLV